MSRYSFLKKITPPLVYDAAYKIRSSLSRKSSSPAKLHTVQGGPLSGHQLYGDINAKWFEEMITGVYDKEFFDYLKNVSLKDGVVVEIGAHIGYHTLVFAQMVGPKGKVYAFEPNPHNLERLNKNLSHNEDTRTKVSVHDFAISDTTATEEFVFGNLVDKGSSSGSFLDRSHTIWEKSIYEGEKIGYKRMKVETRTLDSLRAQGIISQKITLCKIDVEGAEYMVIAGALETLKKDRPIILIEIHSIFNMFKVKTYLDSIRYTLHLLKEEHDGRCFFIAQP